MKRIEYIKYIALVILLLLFFLSGCSNREKADVVLRVYNWEEYIDEGGWGEDEVIELSDDLEIFGENPLYKDFETWYYETYGVKVSVVYSSFGSNEDIYNQLTLGDTFDLICPSEYMIMKLMAEGWLEPYSDNFFDYNNPDNYYIRGVSPFIENMFNTNKIGGEPWSKYAAGYMWGTTGIVYNSDIVSKEEASTWSILNNPKFFKQVTIKDNVRDSYFASLGILKSNLLTNQTFLSSSNYKQRLGEEMNDTSEDTMKQAETLLKQMKGNVYSFETDSGKSDMITGKVVANYQWSGDAVYVMEQAEENGNTLCYTVPKECGNLWFDGWIMLKNGIQNDAKKKHAAEAFVNFLSRPDNAVRNMFYIGYTSVISGGDDSTVFDYADWYYSADDDSEETIDYDVSHFFSHNDKKFIITADSEQEDRGLHAQYPSEEVLKRCSIMNYFDKEINARINQMWINVRCFDFKR